MRSCDLVIIGGGPAGLAAAVAERISQHVHGKLPAGGGGKCPVPAPPGAGGVPAVSDPHQAY